ncbi:hypothetical protein PHYPSEUDO_002251, partial [Phytophthora pseudosyringae]
MKTLSELKDSLTALGVSTATGDLRGGARRDELARRLHRAKVASGEVVFLVDSEEEGEAIQKLEKLSLSELRSALELRLISTQTPMLKGEARRHALLQRLMNTYSNRTNGGEVASGQGGSSDEDEADDTKSETSSSAYSTATEFIFYDSLGFKPELKLEASALMPQLSFTRLKKEKGEPYVLTPGTADSSKPVDNSVEHLQRELFELRTKLHTSRQEQQQLIDRSLREAGIELSLSQISAKLQTLERERRRLQENYFGHELVASEVLSSDGRNQVAFELVQEDALLLIEKHQERLKRLAERTKEAMAVAKFHAGEIESGIAKSARQEDDSLLRQIRQIESLLSSASDESVSSSSQQCWNNSASPKEADPVSETPVLARCRSMPSGLRPELWDQMDSEERKQLQSELRSMASFHIRRDRVSLSISDAIGVSSTTPTEADKLGMKARFMEKIKRNPDEVLRVYQKALELDDNHAENLGSYALFLCTSCGLSSVANDCFQRALSTDPTNAKNLTNYANFLMRERGDYVESETYYKRALGVAPEDVNVMGGYADLLATKVCEGSENLVHARRVLAKALSLSPSHIKNQLRLAVILVALKENDLAQRCFEQLLLAVRKQWHSGERGTNGRKHDRTLASIYENYALFLHQCGQWARAKHMYDEALALDPQRPSLLRNFSCFLRESKPFLSPRVEAVDV